MGTAGTSSLQRSLVALMKVTEELWAHPVGTSWACEPPTRHLAGLLSADPGLQASSPWGLHRVMSAGARHCCACLRSQHSGSRRGRDLEASLGYLVRSCLKTEKKKNKKKKEKPTRQTKTALLDFQLVPCSGDSRQEWHLSVLCSVTTIYLTIS